MQGDVGGALSHHLVPSLPRAHPFFRPRVAAGTQWGGVTRRVDF